MDTPTAVPLARKWVHDPEEGVCFWAALVLLVHGDRSNDEGVAVLRPILDEDDGSWRFPVAFDVLMEVGTEKALSLACGILKKPGFSPGYDDRYILYLLRGLPEPRCPECGAPFARPSPTVPARRNSAESPDATLPRSSSV